MGFKFKLAPTIATAIVLPILMSLGFWQLDRAEQKQGRLDLYNIRAKQDAINLNRSENLEVKKSDDLLYAMLKVVGRYDDKHSFLIDNKVYKGQVGYHIVTPFVIKDSDSIVLVNRGWIKGKRYRADLPEFETPWEEISIKGSGYVPTKNFFVKDNVKIDTQKFPAVIQTVNFEAIQGIINKKTYPFVLRLDPDDKTGFVRDWQIVSSPPEKSHSYAAQWFTMALVVVLIYLSACFNFRRNKKQ